MTPPWATVRETAAVIACSVGSTGVTGTAPPTTGGSVHRSATGTASDTAASMPSLDNAFSARAAKAVSGTWAASPSAVATASWPQRSTASLAAIALSRRVFWAFSGRAKIVAATSTRSSLPTASSVTASSAAVTEERQVASSPITNGSRSARSAAVGSSAVTSLAVTRWVRAESWRVSEASASVRTRSRSSTPSRASCATAGPSSQSSFPAYHSKVPRHPGVAIT